MAGWFSGSGGVVLAEWRGAEVEALDDLLRPACARSSLGSTPRRLRVAAATTPRAVSDKRSSLGSACRSSTPGGWLGGRCGVHLRHRLHRRREAPDQQAQPRSHATNSTTAGDPHLEARDGAARHRAVPRSRRPRRSSSAPSPATASSATGDPHDHATPQPRPPSRRRVPRRRRPRGSPRTSGTHLAR